MPGRERRSRLENPLLAYHPRETPCFLAIHHNPGTLNKYMIFQRHPVRTSGQDHPCNDVAVGGRPPEVLP